MIEAAPNSLGREVLVFQYEFSLSDKLAAALQPLIRSEFAGRELHFFSSRRAFLDLLPATLQEHHDKERLPFIFTQSRERLLLNDAPPVIGAAKNGMLSIRLDPLDPGAFNRLTRPLELLPQRKRQPEMNHFYYTKVPERTLVDQDEQINVLTAYAEQAQNLETMRGFVMQRLGVATSRIRIPGNFPKE